MTVKAANTCAPALAEASADEGLEDDDPFFTALEEIRALGRLPAPHREVRSPDRPCSCSTPTSSALVKRAADNP